MDYTKFHPVEQAEMLSCVLPVIYKCFDQKPIGTEFSKMGTIKAQVLAVKAEGNSVTFSMPSNGQMDALIHYLTKIERNGQIHHRHYNPTDAIMYELNVNQDRTELVMTFYTKEFKMFP